MYDANKNNMWPQQHQHQFMQGSVQPHQQCHRSPSPSPSPSSSSSSSMMQFDHRIDNRHHQHHHGAIDIPVASNPRASRNMAEKQRRDNLNTNISAMAALVPAVAGSSRRMDKISILRLAAAFLRNQYTLGPGTESFLPRHFDFDLEQYVIDNLVANAGFFIVVTTSGKIVYISRYIEHQLGHAQHELLGQSWYNFVCPEDYDELRRNLTPDEMQNTSASGSASTALVKTTEENSSSSDDSTSPRNDKNFTVQRRSFNIRMSQKALNKREHGQYECLQISGQLRLANACANQGSNFNRLRNRDANSTNNDIVFVGIARMIKKRTITDLSLLEATKDEYLTRHLVDGRIIFCDHRISVVAGYMTEEVSGLSAFKFMHKEDVRWTMIALRQMYDRGEGFGSSCYRLLSKTGQFIYLRTHGYLEFDKNTQTVESFVCVNSLMSETEGAKLVKEMKERFAAVISGPGKATITPSSLLPLGSPDVQPVVDPKATVEDPIQLEDAIHHLISDLPSPAGPDSQQSMPLPDNQYYKAAIFSHGLPPASIQADKIGLKPLDCRSPPDRALLDKERRNSVLGSRGLSPIGRRFRDNNNVAGPSMVKVKKEAEFRNLVETTAAKTIDHRIFDEDGSEAPSDGEMRVGNSPSPSLIYEVSNDLQEKQSPRKRMHHRQIVRETADRRYAEGEETAMDSKNLESRVSSSVYEQTRIVGEERNVRKRSRSSEQLPPGSSIPKRKANEMIINQDCGIPRERLDENCDAVFNGIIDGENPEISADRGAGDIREMFGDIQGGITTDVPILESMEACQDFDPVAGASNLLVSTECGQQIEDDVDEDDDLHESMLSPSLDADPDLMKTFEDLQAAVMCNGKPLTIDEANINQFTASDQAVNDGIRRSQFQLEKSIAMRESQLNVLKRDLTNPALLAQRENFTQLEAEHNKQKQMLKTLQQDHLTLQANMHQNIGV